MFLLISYCCHNKLFQTQWLETTKSSFYCPGDQEFKVNISCHLKSLVWNQGVARVGFFPQRFWEKNLVSLTFSVSRGRRGSGLLPCFSPISCFLHHISCSWLWAHCLPLIRTPVTALAHLVNAGYSPSINITWSHLHRFWGLECGHPQRPIFQPTTVLI